MKGIVRSVSKKISFYKNYNITVHVNWWPTLENSHSFHLVSKVALAITI